MIRQMVRVNGKRYALVEPGELRRLERLAAKGEEGALPVWPASDAEGNMPAVAFARVSIARSIIDERRTLGLSQQELARLSGLRQETISRLESGKHSPTIRTVDKIDQALKRAARQQSASRGGKAKAAAKKGASKRPTG
jgi:DNA-binding XRE family transcriptional regulator